MRVWHQLGGRSSATMMFGHAETLEERMEHLSRLRDLQDETQGFTAFICWTFQPDHTEMSNVPPAGSLSISKPKPSLACSSIHPNIQSSWVTQGIEDWKLALQFGANDMGSLMIEENVVAEAGTVHFLTLDQIRSAIESLVLKRGNGMCFTTWSILLSKFTPSKQSSTIRNPVEQSRRARDYQSVVSGLTPSRSAKKLFQSLRSKATTPFRPAWKSSHEQAIDQDQHDPFVGGNFLVLRYQIEKHRRRDVDNQGEL